MDNHAKKVGIAGYGAIGKVVADALERGHLDGLTLSGISSLDHDMPFCDLITASDIIVEALPPEVVPSLAIPALQAGKTIILASTGTLLTYPEIIKTLHGSTGRIIGPYGAIAKIPGINTLKNKKFNKVKIVSIKPPKGFNLDLNERSLIFKGSSRDAVAKYGKNANVSASLAFGCGFSGDDVAVEIWADPAAEGNSHRIIATNDHGDVVFDQSVTNKPDPNNPKTSIGTAESVIEALVHPKSAFFVLQSKIAKEKPDNAIAA